MERDYYSILQVNRRASQEEIERSYERLSRLYDPERSKKRRAPERWQQVKEAYAVLSDPAQRAEYDRKSSARQGPGESYVTRFLASRWGLPGVAGIIGAIVIAAVLVAVFSDGDGDSSAVIGSPTPDAGSPTPVETPPAVTGEEITTESGLGVITIEEGDGPSPTERDTVTVHYTGWLEDGTKFDSSVDRGEPTQFALLGVIDGWTEGLQLMKEGGKARLMIPSELGYGAAGNPPRIPPDSNLIFDIELIEVHAADGDDDEESDTESESTEDTEDGGGTETAE